MARANNGAFLLTSAQVKHIGGFSPAEFFSSLGLMQDLEFDTQLLHSWRVALASYRMAGKLCPENAVKVFYAALLADVGAIHFSRHIVHSLMAAPAGINQKSRVDLFFHPEIAYKSLREMPRLGTVADLVRMHHENIDGSGYPRGLREGDIPKEAMILRLADMLDLVIRTEHPENPDEVRRSLKPFIGESFSAEVFETLRELILDNGLFTALTSDEILKEEMARLVDELKSETLFENIRQIDIFMDHLGDLIDTRNHRFSQGQSRNIRDLCTRIGTEMGLDDERLRRLKWASNLHNLGEISLRHMVLGKKTPLQEEERRLIKRHPLVSCELLERVNGLEDVARIVRHHHENFNGSGYPDAMQGADIPIESRIIRVADAFFAMISERPYRKKRDWRRAVNEIRHKAGTQFDPQVVETAAPLLNQ